MSWSVCHSESERLASEADVARRRGDAAGAEASYVAAGRAEARALRELRANQPRTYGVTAVSATALLFKGKAFAEAEQLAREALWTQFLPSFAKDQIEEIVALIGLERANNEVEAHTLFTSSHKLV